MNSALLSLLEKKSTSENDKSQSTLADKLSSVMMFGATLAVVGVLGLVYIA
ncbi:hypothetical protein [Vibrio spartinae]|uniref:Uncharacterized protein n=1 Tax=Vibrio spartinae TaxID=1918945 RepID=A0A1N6M6S1_9VIBR|nr:hypothetical protein [Vibrio spartinae]QMV13872.1 hypothetical protein Vspart_01117 [Vibrio spartinae]SIO95135.1 hypothetical protein VSP9026_02874 [Vibrio spartinae]